MHQLNKSQLDSVAGWFAAGASLDEIQKRLVSEFGVHLTYLDLRLMVADLPQPEEKAKVEEDGAACTQAADDAADSRRVDDNAPCQAAQSDRDDGGAACTQAADADAAAAPAGSSLSVTVDPITPPGVAACGGVTFSDGTPGKWYLDGYGRLGLTDVPQDYRPLPEDSAVFQTRLMEALRAKGLM